jgi:hypothetical protein
MGARRELVWIPVDLHQPHDFAAGPVGDKPRSRLEVVFAGFAPKTSAEIPQTYVNEHEIFAGVVHKIRIHCSNCAFLPKCSSVQRKPQQIAKQANKHHTNSRGFPKC